MAKDNIEKTQMLERLVAANERLADTLSKLFGLESAKPQGDNQAPTVSGNGGRGYVS